MDRRRAVHLDLRKAPAATDASEGKSVTDLLLLLACTAAVFAIVRALDAWHSKRAWRRAERQALETYRRIYGRDP